MKMGSCGDVLIVGICSLFCFFIIVDTTTVIVDSPFGKIQGLKKTIEATGQTYYSFKGIPYAKPPLDELRFTKPQPHPAIDGIFDATKDEKIMCPHPDLMTYGETGFTENCLVLNIQTKSILASNTLMKVLIFIHGGGFLVGSNVMYDAKSFVTSQDVIMVAINYRLGVLGFLSTENDASPGNYGLWDQTLAIKWVKDNIRAFGGDPDDITIAGESAGGAAVAYQTISPHTKGLFTKAYPQSGTATSVFARAINAQSHALTVAKLAGCWDKSVDDEIGLKESNNIVECLRKVPVSTLTSFVDFGPAKTQFVPTVDGDFVPDIPSKLLQDDAYLDSIGFFDRNYLIALNNEELAIMDNFIQITKSVIFMNNETSTEEKESAWQKVQSNIKDLYMFSRVNGENRAVEAIDAFYNRRFVGYNALLEVVSDLSFLIPSLDFASATSRRKSCSSYLLYFNHFPTFMKGSRRGSPHGVDLVYWFDGEVEELERILQAGMEGQMTDEDLQLKQMFSSILGEFIKSGNPGLALSDVLPSGWPKYDVINSYYLDFSPRPWISSFLEKDKQDLWFHILPNLMKKSHVHSEL